MNEEGIWTTKGQSNTAEQIADALKKELDAASITKDLVFPKSIVPKASIIILNYNKGAYTFNCLSSVLRNTEPGTYEVILVDNGSTEEESKQILKRLENVKILTPGENLGFIRGNNYASKHAIGEYMLFLNNDTIVLKGWLKALLKTFERDDKVAIAGSKFVFPSGALQEAGAIIFNDGSATGYGRNVDDPSIPEYQYVREVDYCSGASLMVRKDLFTELGGFSELYVPAYYEDADLCYRARQKGYKVVYNPFSIVIHYEGVTSGIDPNSPTEVKRFEIVNRPKFISVWKDDLQKRFFPLKANVLHARDLRKNPPILIIDRWISEPDDGSSGLRNYNMAQILSQLGYKVTLYALEFKESIPADYLRELGVEIIPSNYITIDRFLKERSEFYSLVIINTNRITPSNITHYFNQLKHNDSVKIRIALLIEDANEFCRVSREIKPENQAGNRTSEEPVECLTSSSPNLLISSDFIFVMSERDKILINNLVKDEQGLITHENGRNDLQVYNLSQSPEKPLSDLLSQNLDNKDTRDLEAVNKIIMKLQIEEPLAVLLLLYEERPDLQQAFPEVKNGDYNKLIRWAAIDGISHDSNKDLLLIYKEWYMTAKLTRDSRNINAITKTDTISQVPSRRQKPDIICFPIIEWDYRHQRTQHLLARLARKGHRIFHLTSSLRPLGQDFAVNKIIDNVFEVHLNVPYITNVYKDVFVGEKMDFLFKSLNSAIKQLDIDDAISWVVFPTWTHMVLKLKEMYGWNIIYDCLDAHTGFTDVNKIREEEEKLLIKESDLVITSSLYLYKYARAIRNDRILLLQNACEFQHFNVLPPNQLVKVKKPIIGYIGAIRDWLDTELIEFLATAKKDCNFVLIGHVADGNKSSIERLRKLPNVHFLGEKIYHDLPKYIFHFDVCLIPFRETILTDATNPVKFYEYLASGKPIVMTKMSDLQPVSELCYMAENHEDFLKKLEIALNENDQQLVKDRIDFAKRNTWKHRMDVLYPHVETLNTRQTINSTDSQSI